MVRISVMFDSPGAGFMDIPSQQRPQFRDYNHRALYRKFETPFFSDGSHIADPARCQLHLCLAEITVLRGLLIISFSQTLLNPN